MRRLLPHPTDHVTVAEMYGVARHRLATRPWIGVCMVSSLDGSTVSGTTSRGLSSDSDRAVLVGLRRCADVVVVGAATVRIEGYGVPSKPGQRVGVVSRTGNVDVTTELFTSGSGFLILPETAPATTVPCIRAGRDEVDLSAAMEQLDVSFVQAEGGAALNGALAAAGLIDELNLTVSPVISGDDGPRLTRGAPPLDQAMELVHVLEDDGFLFTRWVRAQRGT